MQATPRVLLVEDDPVSRAVLAAAVAPCGAEVDATDSVHAALSSAASGRHALWLIDAHLPDGSGIDLLTALRTIDSETVAVAHTASPDAGLHAALRQAGFVDVLIKPLSAERITAALDEWLPAPTWRVAEARGPAPAYRAPPLWDDEAAALALNGQREHVAALRALFIAELSPVAGRIAVAARTCDAAALRHELHRLRASCGFVGALRVAAAVRGLEARPDAAALRDFERAVQATLADTEASQPA